MLGRDASARFAARTRAGANNSGAVAPANFKMSRRLRGGMEIPTRGCEPEQQPAKAAADYESEVRHFFQQHKGMVTGADLFDLVLLGLGEDGHIASLFPGSPALLEKEHWFVMVEHNQPPPPLVTRVTATLPLINTARHVTFLVSGLAVLSLVVAMLVKEANLFYLVFGLRGASFGGFFLSSLFVFEFSKAEIRPTYICINNSTMV